MGISRPCVVLLEATPFRLQGKLPMILAGEANSFSDSNMQ